MVFAARLSAALGHADLTARHARLLASLGLETGGALPPADELIAAMRMDKKYRGGVRFVLLEDVGRPVVADAVSDDVVRAVLEGG
jgi:3-dehydroquinate synthetase